MSKFSSYFFGVLQAVGAAVDAIVPAFIGSRTKIAVLACPILSTVGAVLPAIAAPLSGLPGVGVAVQGVQVALPYVQNALCAAAPAFALAGVARNTK